MANALDTFREQRAAAGQVYAALKESSELVRGLQSQVNALTRIDELKNLLQQENRWLHEAERVVSEMRRLRNDEIRRPRLAVKVSAIRKFICVRRYQARTKRAFSTRNMVNGDMNFTPTPRHASGIMTRFRRSGLEISCVTRTSPCAKARPMRK